MAKFASAIATVFACFLFGSPVFAAGPFGVIHVGEWRGGAFTNESNGSFSHCAATATYLSGVSLLIGETSQRTWLLGFSYPTWSLTPGQTYQIELTFDGQRQFHIFGAVATSKLISAILPTEALSEFRKAHLMVASTNNATGSFNLTKTERLTPIIANCVNKVLADGIASAGDFSVLPPMPPATPAAQKSTVVASAEQNSTNQAEQLIAITGTGFLINSSGYVVTNNHVISDCVGDVHGNLVGEAPETLRVVSSDETNDLALLKANGTFKNVATIKRTAVHSGDPIIAIGFPFHGLLTSDFTVTTGIVSSLAGLFNDTRFLQISAPVQPGNSGGPLLDMKGEIVGVVAEKISALKIAKATGDLPENINFAIKTGALQDFLDNSVVSYETTEPTTDLKTADIASAARAYTMLVSCTGHEPEAAKK